MTPVGSAAAFDEGHFQARVIQDALREASALQWERRAATLEWARPRPSDFHGEAIREDLRARWSRLTEQAQACRNHATVLRGGASG